MFSLYSAVAVFAFPTQTRARQRRNRMLEPRSPQDGTIGNRLAKRAATPYVTNTAITFGQTIAENFCRCIIQNTHFAETQKMNWEAKMKAVLLAVLSATLMLAPLQTYAVSSKQAEYDGGTVTQIPKTQKGKLITGDANLRFEWKQADYAIPYASIVDMEYGNKPSTRIGTSIGVAIICWPCGIASLFIKAKHHFLTLEFTQGTTKQAVVFELGKALPQTMLPVLEVKTGKKITYQQKN